MELSTVGCSFSVSQNGPSVNAIILSVPNDHPNGDHFAPVEYCGDTLAGARVLTDDADIVGVAQNSGFEYEVVRIPAGDARDAFIRKWAEAAKRNKKGLLPVLLLPLAACGGGSSGPDPLTSYAGTIEGAKAQDVSKYTSSFSITLSDGPSVSATDLTIIANKTTGDVTSASVTEVTGSAADVRAVLEEEQLVSLAEVNVTITEAHSLPDLKAINTATTGTISFNDVGDNTGDPGIALSGTSADLAAALEGITTYTGAVTLNDAHTLSQLKLINDGTSGGITLGDSAVQLVGTAADILAALDGVAPYSGDITVSGLATATDIEAIAQLTTGTLTATLNAGQATLDLTAATSANFITVTDDVNVTGSDQADKLIIQNGADANVFVVDLGNGADEVRIEDGAIIAAEGDRITITDAGDVADSDILTVSGTNVFDSNSSWQDIEVLEIESNVTFTAKQINAVSGNIKVADAVKDDGGEHKVTIAAVSAADLAPGETLEEANAVSLSSLEGVTSIAVDKGIEAEVALEAAQDLVATKEKYKDNADVDTGIEIIVDDSDPTSTGIIVVSAAAKKEIEDNVPVKVGGEVVTTIPYAVGDSFANIQSELVPDPDYVKNAISVSVTDPNSLSDLNGASLEGAKKLTFKGGIQDQLVNLLDGGGVAFSAELSSALSKDASAQIIVSDAVVIGNIETLMTAGASLNKLTYALNAGQEMLGTLGYSDIAAKVAIVDQSSLKAAADATVTLDAASSVANIETLTELGVPVAGLTYALTAGQETLGTLGYSDIADKLVIVDTASNFTASDATVTVSAATSVSNIEALASAGAALSNVTYDLNDAAAALTAGAAAAEVAGATKIAVSDAASIGNIETLISSGASIADITYSLSSDAEKLGSQDYANIADKLVIVDTASNFTASDATVTVSAATSVSNIEALTSAGATLSNITYNLDDAFAALTAGTATAEVAGATNLSVSDAVSIGNIETLVNAGSSLNKLTYALTAGQETLGTLGYSDIADKLVIVDTASNFTASDATVTVSAATSVSNIEALASAGAALSNVTYDLNDAAAALTAGAAAAEVAGATKIAVSDAASIGNIETLISSGASIADITYSLSSDAEKLGSQDYANIADKLVIVDTASNFTASDATVTVSAATSVSNIEALTSAGATLSNITYNLDDAFAALTAGTATAEVAGATNLSVSDAVSIGNIETLVNAGSSLNKLTYALTAGQETLGTLGYSDIADKLVIVDTASNFTASDATVTVSAATSVSNIEALASAGAALSNVTYDLNDAAAALTAGAAAAEVAGATKIAVSDVSGSTISVSDIIGIMSGTSSAVTLSNAVTLSGSATEFNGLGSSLGNLTFELSNLKVTGDSALTLDTLKSLNVKTAGAIDLNTATLGVDWSGTTNDIASALSGLSGLGGDITISNASSLEDLKVIQSVTSGTVSLNEKTFAISGASVDIKAALTGIQGYEGDITVTDQGLTGITGVNLVNETNALTSGVVTATVSGSASQLKSLATGTSDNISITPTSVVTLTEYNQIVAKTGLDFSYSGATETSVTEDVAKTLTLDDFSFTGSNQSDISSVVIASATRGSLKLDGAPVSLGDEINAQEIVDGNLIYQTLSNDAGDDSFKFLVKENDKSSGNEVTLTLDVTAVDDQPVNTVPSATIQIDEKSTDAILGISVSDSDTGIVEVTLGVNSGTLSIKTDVSGGLSASNISQNDTNTVVLSGTKSAVNATLAHAQGVQFTPASDDADIAVTLTVTTTSGESGVDQDTISIFVNDVDEPPTLSVVNDASLTIQQGEALDISLLAQDDIDSSPNVTITEKPNWVNVISSLDKITSAVTTNSEVGSHTIKLTVDDGASNIVAKILTVIVENVNDKPVYSPPLSQDITVDQDASFSIDLSTLFSDPDAGSAAPTLTVIDKPDAAVFDASTGILTWTPVDEDLVGDNPATNGVSLTATDVLNAETDAEFTITVTNTNDAPIASDKLVAEAVTEGVWTSGAVEKTLQSLTMVIDPDDGNISNFSVAISQSTGIYGSLAYNSDTDTFSYTPVLSSVEALTEGETVSDSFSIVFTDAGNLSSESKTLSFGLIGENDLPTVTAPSFEELDSGAQNVTVGVLTGTDDVDTATLAFELTTNVGTDNTSFEIANGNELKLKTGVTTSSSASPYVIEVVAIDGEGDQSTPLSFEVTVNTTDNAPSILSVNADKSDKDLGIDETLTLTATASEAVTSNSGTATFNITLSNNEIVVMTRSSSDATKFTGTYTVEAGDTSSSDLNVLSYDAGNVIDTGSDGNALDTEQGAFALTNLTLDATRPEATISATGHTYNSAAGTLVLAGEKLNTLGASDGDSVKSLLDWTKLTWNAVGGTSVPTEVLAVGDIDTAVVDTAENTITVVLNSATDTGSTALHALANFGGTGAGKVDTITVSEGFLKDSVGNTSAQSAATATIEMVDQTAPVVVSVTAVTSTGEATVGVGESITFTATMTDDNAMKVGTSFTLSLSNGASVTLERTDSTGVKEMVGVYTIAEGDTDSSDLTIASMSASPTASDVSGNILVAATPSLTNTTAIAVKGTLSEATISATGHTYNSAAGTLVLAGEKLNTLGASDGDSVKSLLDWTKLTWNAVGGTSVPTEVLAVGDIDTAVVDTAENTITVVLNSATDTGSTALHALANFGGTGAGKVDTITVSEGFLKDIFGNASSAQNDTTATIEMVDQTAPVVVSVTAVTSTGEATVGVGESITFTATMTDDNAMKVGTSFTLSLSNGASVTLERTDSTGVKEMVGVYTIAEGDTDSSDLTIASMSASPTASDVSGNILVAATPSLTNTTAIAVKGTLSEATISATGHTYNSAAGTLVLAGEKLNTLGASDGDSVKSLLDWTKLTWNAVGGTSVPTEVLAVGDIDTAVVDTAENTITVVLNSATDTGSTALHALANFGGTGAGKVDTITVSEGFLKDIFGNASSAQNDTTATIEMVDQTAPVVVSVTAVTSTGEATVGVGESITFTATMTDDNAMKVGTSFTLSLSNGASVTLERTDSTGVKEMVGVYTIAEGDTDSSDLTIASMSASPTASDVSGNILVAATPSLTNTTAIAVDTTAPTAKLQSSGHSLNTLTDTLTLSINNVGTLGESDGASVKSQLDWTKLVWNAVGDPTNSMTFSSADISSAVVDTTGEAILVTLAEGTDLGATKLYAFSGFGGIGGKIDTVQASAGFLNDSAGNSSSEEDAVTTVDVSMVDTTVPVIKSITAEGPSGATLVGAGDLVTFTAVMTDVNEMRVGTKFIINLDDDLGSVELIRTANTAVDEFVGEYTVQSSDNSDGLTISNYMVPSTGSGAQDISGNKLEGGASLSLTNDDDITVDTAAPLALAAHTYVTNKLTVILSEAITNQSRTNLENGLLELTGVNAVTDSYSKVLGLRLDIDSSFNLTQIDITNSAVNLEDTYGNNALVTTIDVI
ncbi:hypothetical protein ACMAY8_18380 [Rhodobacteraceae bacterium nBUS_22]